VWRVPIRADRMAVVVVGDHKAIEPGIRALNLGGEHHHHRPDLRRD
jgi:hypothetical protein